MNTLTGKVAIVTGASKGIGAGIAKAFSAEGATVVVNYSSNKAGADRVLAEIADAGGNAIAVQANVSDPADVKRLFAETKEAFGRLDILVNNAGVFKFEPFECISVAEFNREFSTNVLGPILTIQEAIKQFGFEEGRVINISSLAGNHSLPMEPSILRQRPQACNDGSQSRKLLHGVLAAARIFFRRRGLPLGPKLSISTSRWPKCA